MLAGACSIRTTGAKASGAAGAHTPDTQRRVNRTCACATTARTNAGSHDGTGQPTESMPAQHTPRCGPKKGGQILNKKGVAQSETPLWAFTLCDPLFGAKNGPHFGGRCTEKRKNHGVGFNRTLATLWHSTHGWASELRELFVRRRR